MKNIDWKDLVKRALWTFVEAFIAAFSVGFNITDEGWKAALWSAILSAVAAGISAVKTFLVEYFKKPEPEPIPEPKPEPEPQLNYHKIYLSPSGQYGNTYAKPYNYTNEGQQCEKIAAECQRALTEHGFIVMNGAGKDYDKERYPEAKAFGAELYIPIHTNAFDGKVTGTRMFVRSFTEEPSYTYCKTIFKYLDAIMPGTSSNIKEQPKFVEFIGMTGTPAVYCECDFHDNPDIAGFIVGHTKEIGEAIAQGICECFGVAW